MDAIVQSTPLAFDASKSANVTLSQFVGDPKIPAHIKVGVHHGNLAHPYVPEPNEDYVFSLDFLRAALPFFHERQPFALSVMGPHGAGKTSAVVEYLARAKWPVVQTVAKRRGEFRDFLGYRHLAGGATSWVDGPLTLAYRHGMVLLVNEWNRMEPSEIFSFNQVLDGAPLVLEENDNEVVHRHPFFRLVLTGNGGSLGDDTGLYAGVEAQDVSLVDRLLTVVVDYPAPDVELAILEKVEDRRAKAGGNRIATQVLEKMIEVANDVRAQFVGKDLANGTLSVVVSTRTLLRWAHVCAWYPNRKDRLRASLQLSLLNGLPAEQASTIAELAKDRFGDLWG